MRESDDRLISQYLGGDAEAFDRLYGRYARRLIGFVAALGAGRDEAEDLAQRTWMKAIDHFAAYEARGRFRAWLFTAARRLWIDERRLAWNRRRVDLEPMMNGSSDGRGEGTGAALEGWRDPGPGPRERAIKTEERQRLAEGLGELSSELRQTVLLRIDGELTYREIAEAMGCPLGTALWRAREAERRLQSMLGSEPKEKAR